MNVTPEMSQLPNKVADNMREDRSHRTMGTENYWVHLFGLKYTDGVKAHAALAEAWWLIDAIASYQPDLKRHEEKHRWWMVWQLKVKKDGTAVLTARSDTGERPFITQKLEFTTHPEGEWDFWQEGNVLIIPEEH